MKHHATTAMSVRKKDWWIYAVPILLLLLITFQLVLLSKPGKIGLVIYYLGPLLISLLAVLFFIAGIIYSLIKRPFFTKWRMLGFAGLLLFPLGYLLRAEQEGNFFNTYPSSHTGEQSKVSFRLPLDTVITVGWGGDDLSTNYHAAHPDQRWAYDLLVTQNGRSFSGDSSRRESYFCYGLPVLAPASGEVVRAFDSVNDQRPGDLSETVHVGGNQIVLKVAENEFLFLCHLKPKSILVKEGERVSSGQPLALVGNSGHTSEPHLHIHLQDTKADDLGEGIPLYFSNYSDGEKIIAKGMPTGGFDDKMNFIGQKVKHMK